MQSAVQLGDCSPLFMGKEEEGKRKYPYFHQGEKRRKRKGKKNEEVRKLFAFDKSF